MTTNSKVDEKQKQQAMEQRLEESRLLQEEHQKQTQTSYQMSRPEPVGDDDDEDYLAILKAYEEQFKRKPPQDEQGRNLLGFKTPEAAKNFFEGMAKDNKKFLALALGTDGKPNGQYMMSVGDGKFTQGTVPPNKINTLIEDYKKQTRPSAESSPNSAFNMNPFSTKPHPK